MNKRIVVVGSSNIDLLMKVDQLPEKGETVTDGEFMQCYGGKGANQAVAAARAGAEVAFVSCVGDDAYTPEMVRNYTADNIDTRFVFQDQGIASGHALIMIGDGGMNYISVAPGANHRLTRTRVAEALPVIEEAGMVLLQNEVPETAREHAIDLARERDIPVLWNFAPARESNPAYLSRVTHLCVNEIEAGALAGVPVDSIEDAEEAADILVEKGVEGVVLTLGEQGALFVSRQEKVEVPAYDVDAVDTTAAGDTFCGAFAVAWVEGQDLEQALRFANAAAAISTTRMGAQPSVPTRKEVDEFLRSSRSHR